MELIIFYIKFRGFVSKAVC